MTIRKQLAILAAVVASAPVLLAGELDAEYGGWKFTMGNKLMTVEQNGTQLLKGVYMTAWDENDNDLESNKYDNVTKKEEDITDAFGSGKRFTWTYTKSGSPTLEQIVSVYPSLPYATFEGAVVAPSGTTSTRQICPIVVNTTNTLPLETSENRIYNMPFANDNWATFSTTRWNTGQLMTSCEATALFNVASRKGLVIGSIDHSVWKSAINVQPNSTNRLRKLSAQAGYVSLRTWDNNLGNDRADLDKHGAVKGARVVSPRFMLGMFDDWRNGLETYGVANTVLCPKLKMPNDEKSIFGWQSWGGQEAQLNYTSAMSVLDFFEKELKPVDFADENGTCWMVLDSFWDNMSRMERREFAKRCKELGYHPGIYTTPFSIWLGNDDEVSDYHYETVDGKTYSRKDVVLTANGKPRKITGYSLDPTHPAVKEANRKRFQEFKEDGFEYVKIDFMNNGSQEADRWYDPDITTGMMAYNYGMDYILEMAGDMVLDFSIAPVFPAKAHIRRIGCDAWGELNNSMYTLNCINGSWWLDQCYAFNDPDLMCLNKVFTGKGSNDEQEARIRYTSGIITGHTLFGGTYAYEGGTMNYNGKPTKIEGTDEERARAVKFASNKDLTEVARIGKTFRPVEGTLPNETQMWQLIIPVDNEFIYDTPEAFYYVVFNYDTSKPFTKQPDFDRLGIKASDFVNVKELWTGTTCKPSELQVSVPAKDVRIYRLERSGYSGVAAAVADPAESIDMTVDGKNLNISAVAPISSVTVYGIDGTTVNSIYLSGKNVTETSLNLGKMGCGMTIASVTLESGLTENRKILFR